MTDRPTEGKINHHKLKQKLKGKKMEGKSLIYHVTKNLQNFDFKTRISKLSLLPITSFYPLHFRRLALFHISLLIVKTH